MADLDTRLKRESSIGICLPFLRVLPSSSPGGMDANIESERAHLCMNYNGIPTAAATGRIMGSLIGPSGLIGQGGGMIA